MGSDLVRHQVAFTDTTPSDFIFTAPVSLGSTWLDVLHSDDLSWQGNTVQSVPGQTLDFIWQWTGEMLGWDVYGHAPGDDPAPDEYMPDHGTPFPVIVPERDSVAFGDLYPGSPFLGGVGELPPGHPGLNAIGAYMFIWHSHTEKELTSNDVFPGGALTFMFVVDHSIPID